MRSGLIKILHALLEKTAQITLAENDPVIQKLFTYGSIPSFDKGIAVGHTKRSPVQRDVVAIF